VFVTGQVGLTNDGALVAGGIVPEGYQTIGNVKSVLASLERSEQKLSAEDAAT